MKLCAVFLLHVGTETQKAPCLLFQVTQQVFQAASAAPCSSAPFFSFIS